MSSRILTGEQAADVRPIRWRRAGSGAGNDCLPCSGGEEETAAAERVAALDARVHELEAELTRREAQARAEGERAGESSALERLQEPLAQAARGLSEQVEQLTSMRVRFRREAEADVARLALAIARRILHRELAVDPGALLGLVKAALERLESRDVLRLRVHPDHEGIVREALGAASLPTRVEVVGDAGLERGGLVVETSRGDLDASVDAQLGEIERGFTDLVERSGR